MNQIVFELFKDLLLNKEQEKSFDMILQRPVLLWPRQWKFIESRLSELPSNLLPEANNLLQFLQTIYQKLHEDISYPFGYGPIEAIFDEYQRGEISAETAIVKAKKTQVYSLLSPLYVSEITGIIQRQTYDYPDSWKEMFLLLDLLLAAVDALTDVMQGDAEWYIMKNSPSLTYLSVATNALVVLPDKRILDKAVAIGKRILTQGSDTVKPGLRSEFLHRLGVLHLDSYFYKKNSSLIHAQLNAWQNRLYDYYGDALAGLKPEDIEMPSAPDSLKIAISYFEQAASLRSGIPKALTLKALAESLAWQNILSDQKDFALLRSICQEALELLKNESGYEEITASLHRFLKLAGEDHQDLVDENILQASATIIQSEPDALIKAYGVETFFAKIPVYMSYFMDRQPQTSLNLYIKAQEVMDRYPGEAFAVNHYQVGTELIFKFADSFISTVLKFSTEDALQAFFNRNQQQQIHGLTFYCSVLSIALRSTVKNEEQVGLKVLDRVFVEIQEDDSSFHFLLPLIRYSYASMEVGEAVNQLDAGNTNEALRLYFSALKRYNNLAYERLVQGLLDRIVDLGRNCDQKGCELILACISTQFIALEQTANEAIRRKCLDLLHLLLQRFCSVQPMKLLVLFMIFQLLKGYSFAQLLQSPLIIDLKNIPEVTFRLQMIGEMFNSLPTKFPSTKERIIDKDTLLIGYAGNEERFPGDDDYAKLSNMRISFDNLFHKHILKQLKKTDHIYFPEQVQEILDAKTVLWVQYIGPSPDGLSAIYSMFISNDQVRLTMGYSKDFPSMTVEFSKDGLIAKMPIITLEVAECRKAIVLEEPDDEEVSVNGREKLQTQSGLLLGGDIPSFLDKFKKEGKDHLCVWAHKAYHYFPFHLLPQSTGKLLGEEWIVTGIPNIALISAKPQAATIASQISVLAMTFTHNNPYSVSPLPDAVKFTQAIADLFEVGVVSDQALTEPTFKKALNSSRYVHLYTHGYLNVDAPTFQCLFVEPGDGDDGIIYAHEIAGMDLRHIDLLSLCACESALGRFDTADNLRGLPASFLLAGVSTIIGTLWEAEAESAACFFKSMYTSLKGGISKKQAFKSAQVETRKLYPQYRDWGAFYYLGQL